MIWTAHHPCGRIAGVTLVAIAHIYGATEGIAQLAPAPQQSHRPKQLAVRITKDRSGTPAIFEVFAVR
jgi:hypothetical protein